MKYTFLCLLFALPALAWDVSQIQNADVRVVSAKRNGEQQLSQMVERADDRSWIAYSFDARPGYGPACCSGGCSLSDNNWTSRDRDHTQASRLMLFMRIEKGRIDHLRMFADQCPLDGEGATIQWIDGISDEASLAFLGNQVTGSHPESVMAAIALHRNEVAGDMLQTWALGDQRRTAKPAIFWLANVWGARGMDVMRQLVNNSDDREIREHVTFGLHISKEPGSKELLKSMALDDPSRHVQGQAMFWLAKSGGEDAVEIIFTVLNNNSGGDLTEKAVFAVSQLPDGEGTPYLEQMVREHQDHRVRSKALFWLAQSDGETAAPIIEDILADDASAELQEQAVFAMSQLDDELAVQKLIKLAETHERDAVRGKALFWLAQKAGDRVTAHLEKAANEDPSHEVRKQAIFALYQSGEEGVASLIEVARNHENGDLRKQAIFWLGQSKHPKAIEVIKEVLQ